jgi:hypothetical protein
VATKHGVSDQTIDAGRKRFGTLEPTDVKRLGVMLVGFGSARLFREPVTTRDARLVTVGARGGDAIRADQSH